VCDRGVSERGHEERIRDRLVNLLSLVDVADRNISPPFGFSVSSAGMILGSPSSASAHCLSG